MKGKSDEQHTNPNAALGTSSVVRTGPQPLFVEVPIRVWASGSRTRPKTPPPEIGEEGRTYDPDDCTQPTRDCPSPRPRRIRIVHSQNPTSSSRVHKVLVRLVFAGAPFAGNLQTQGFTINGARESWSGPFPGVVPVSRYGNTCTLGVKGGSVDVYLFLL